MPKIAHVVIAPDRPPLTKRQAQCLAIIRRHWIEHGHSPSLLYICQEFGISASANGAMAHIRLLVKKGYLRGVPAHHRDVKKRTTAERVTYVLTDPELVVKTKGERVRIAMTGPGVEMSRDEWKEWLEERLGEVNGKTEKPNGKS
jgi:SOS-response transcriptional repressor LexA